MANTIRVLERPAEVRVLSSPSSEPKETRAIDEVSAEQLQLTLVAEAIHDALWPNAPRSQTTTNHRRKLLNAARQVTNSWSEGREGIDRDSRCSLGTAPRQPREEWQTNGAIRGSGRKASHPLRSRESGQPTDVAEQQRRALQDAAR